MNLRAGILLIILAACGLPASAQSLLVGNLRDSASLAPVTSANVLNVNTGKSELSRREGIFSLSVKENDLLAVSANGFYSDTLRITDSVLALQRLIITLRPLPATLADVTITAGYNRYQRDSIQRRASFMKTIGPTDIPVASRPNSGAFGVALNLDHFGKSQRKRRNAISLFEVMENDAYINYRWTEELVGKYTGLKEDELIDFMQMHRPEYEWLRRNPIEEDLVHYINRILKKRG